MEKPQFNWKDFEISAEEALKARLLVEDGEVVNTFLEALDLLKQQRRRRSISIEEFTKGLIEIAAAIERFLEHEDAFTDTEIKLQVNMLEGFVELLCECLQLFTDGCPFVKRFEGLRSRYEKGELNIREYWKELIELAVDILNFLHDADIPPKYLRYILSVILAFVDYFQCVLIHKRELVEDFFGGSS